MFRVEVKLDGQHLFPPRESEEMLLRKRIEAPDGSAKGPFDDLDRHPFRDGFRQNREDDGYPLATQWTYMNGVMSLRAEWFQAGKGHEIDVRFDESSRPVEVTYRRLEQGFVGWLLRRPMSVSEAVSGPLDAV